MINKKHSITIAILFTLAILPFTGFAFENTDIKDAALTYVKNGLSESYPNIKEDSVTITFKNLEQFYELIPTDAVTFKISDKTPKDRLGTNVVKVNFYNKKGYFMQHNSMLTFVDVQQTFYVTKNLLRPGHIIELDDLEVVKESLNGKPKTIVTSKDDLIGKEVAYIIQKGAFISKWMVKISPLVRKGDRITIKLENHAVNITFDGKALEDGGKGDRIKVQSEKTRTLL